MKVNVCPKCGGRVMSFPQFLRSAEPGKSFICPACGAVLRRHGAVWLLLVVAGALFAALPLLLIRAEWSPLAILLVTLLAAPVWFFAVKFVGWTIVPWRLRTTA